MAFNIAGARQAGYSDEEIQRYLAIRQGEQTPQQGGGIADYLPLLGAIGGSFIPGAGTILGGALGAGAGTLLKQSMQGGGEPGEIIKEAALGGAGGILGKGIGAVAGKILPKGAAQIAGQAGVKVGARAGAGLGEKVAAKTIASNFTIPPKLASQLQIEDALGQMIQDGVKIPNSIQGYQTIANQITGSNGAITLAQRAATKNLKTPINFDEALTSARSGVGLKGSLSPDERLDVVATIRNYFNNRAYPAPGHISADDALDIANQLDKEGYNLLNKGINELSPNAALEAKGETFIGVAEDLRQQMYRAIDSSGKFKDVQAEAVKQLQKISPELGQKAAIAQNMTQLRSLASPYVRINRAAQSTINRQQTPFVGGGLQLGTRGTAALAGGALGGLPGAAVGAAFGPMAAGAAQAAQPAITGLTARGMIGAGKLAGGVSKIPTGGAGKLATAGIGQIGVRAGLPQPQQAQEGEELSLEQETLQPPDNTQLRAAFAMAILQNPKQASAIKLAYDLLAGSKGGQLTAQGRDKLLSINQSEELLNSFERNLSKIGLTPGIGSLIVGGGKKLAGKTHISSNAAAYEDLREGMANVLSKSLGQVGNLSDKDIERAVKLIPDLTDTPQQASIKLQTLRQILHNSKSYIQTSGSQNSIPLPQDLGELGQ